MTVVNKNTFEDTAEQREAFYDNLWKSGGFRFWLAHVVQCHEACLSLT